MMSSKKKHKDLCSQYEFGGGKPSFSCKEVYPLIIEFSSSIESIYNKIFKRRAYNQIKNELYNLNIELDKYDNKNKNKFDQTKYDSLDDPEKCFYLIEDIFDNYRPNSMKQVYNPDETNKIHEVLDKIKIIDNSGFFQSFFAMFNQGVL